MDPITTLSLSVGGAWASGINLYASILVLGLLHRLEVTALPANLEILSHPAVLSVAALMYCIEFFADKIPGVDSAWDMVHTFIRVPAGALLAASAVGDVPAAWVFAAGLAGGAIATGSHLVKSGSRVAINTSPEPVSNWIASLTEDFAVICGLYTALNYPWAFFVLFALFVAFAVWALPRIIRGLAKILKTLSSSVGLLTDRKTDS